jgi:serine/threonine-protein kinase HipA
MLPGAFPLSQSIPIRDGRLKDPSIHYFFDNLLPESEAIRKAVATQFKLESTESVELLSAIGRDCVGALQVLPADQAPEKPKVVADPISDTDVEKLVTNLTQAPFGPDSIRDFRISIAGAQEKTALLFHDKKWKVPHGTTPTSHILKPQIGKLKNGINLSQSVENEWMCAQIARHMGLPVAHTEIRQFGKTKCLVVERFDRKWNAAKTLLERIHQEDLCQALGYSAALKYESEGGPGIIKILGFLAASDTPKADREAFLRSQILYWLLAATDGHAKNFSIHLRGGGFNLCPLYDILTVFPALAAKQLQKKEAKVAMAVGDNRHWKLSEIHLRHWQQTEKKSGLPSGTVEHIVESLAKRAESLDVLSEKLSQQVPPELVETTLTGLRIYLKRLL